MPEPIPPGPVPTAIEEEESNPFHIPEEAIEAEQDRKRASADLTDAIQELREKTANKNPKLQRKTIPPP